jgi:rhamnose transport system permease protein
MLLVLFAFLEWRTDRFLDVDNLQNIAMDAALLGLCALGASLVILAGGLDISLGALMALSAGVAGRLWEQGHSLPGVAVVAIGMGGFAGMLNAGVTVLGRVHPIVVTLGTLSLYRGLTLWWLQPNVQISGSHRDWLFMQPLGVPLSVWIGLAILTLAWQFLGRTIPGREIYALGSNPAAAHRIGISRTRIWLVTFTLQGMLAGLAGFLHLAQSGSLQPTSYEDKTLEAIAAAVVGGVAIMGGRGSVWGVALGCFLLVSLRRTCAFLEIAPHWQQTLIGAVLVLAVTIDTLWRRRVSNS